jgi:hypothetical protein
VNGHRLRRQSSLPTYARPARFSLGSRQANPSLYAGPTGMACTSSAQLMFGYGRTPTWTGPTVRTSDALHRAIVSSLVTRSCHGRPSTKLWCRAPVRKPNTALSQTPPPSVVDCVNSSRSFTSQSTMPTVTTYLRCICHRTRCMIGKPSTCKREGRARPTTRADCFTICRHHDEGATRAIFEEFR